MTWFRPIDPTGGALGTGSRYSARTGGPRAVVPPAAPAAVPVEPVVESAPAAGLGMGGFAHDPAAPLAPGKVLEYTWPAVPATVPAPAVVAHRGTKSAKAPRVSAPRRATGCSLAPDTLRGRILVALGKLTAGRATPVSVEDLTLCAWRLFPVDFGMFGHEHEHPDNNTVLAKLSGDSGLTGMALAARPRPGMVALTPRGARWWRGIGKPWLAEQKEKR